MLLQKNGIEWCEENFQLYQILKQDFFEHHNHSIESRVCANLYSDPLWTYYEYDRFEKLIERSRYYVQLEIKESAIEAETGNIDTNPAKEIPEIEEDSKATNLTNDQIHESKTTESEPRPDVGSSYDDNNDKNDESGGGCLIATAAYGTELAPQVQFLREVRDNTLLSTTAGTTFMTGFNQAYYSFSPTIADWERENPMFRDTVRAFITPMVSSLSIMTLADQGSESQVLGLGISIIALNIGLYIAAPAIGIMQIKNKSRRSKFKLK